MMNTLLLLATALFLSHRTQAFVVTTTPSAVRQRPMKRAVFPLSVTTEEGSSASSSSSTTTTEDTHNGREEEPPTAAVVRAPLRYIGPYPCLALRFPELATSKQRAADKKGVSLDFVVDTAANVNAIQAAVAQELRLNKVGRALPGVSAAGALPGGDTYLLGDAELDGIPDKFTFMTNLTASALPVASPAAAGLLSLAFLQCFEGGIEFDWGRPTTTVGEEEGAVPPSLTFYGEPTEQGSVEGGMQPVTIKRIPVTQLPSVTIRLNGVEMPALLDTGSPITVLNAAAAQQAGIETVPDPSQGGRGPFAAVASRFQQAQAASRGDVLTIMGANGKPANLLKSTAPCRVSLPTSSGAEDVDFQEGHVYVGDLPGLAALNGLGVESPPAVVLGMDVLRRRPKMLLRAQDDQVWF